MSDTALCVLAGGQSQRFGSPKSNVTVNGTPICAWLVSQLRSVAEFAILSIAKDSPAIAGEEVFDQIIVDQQPNAGPLSGMHSVVDALSQLSQAIDESDANTKATRPCNNIVFVTADMPFMSITRIHQLIEALQESDHLTGVMNCWSDESLASMHDSHRGEGVEPFPSVWEIARAAELFKVTLNAGNRSPFRLVDHEAVKAISVSEAERNEFSSFNTQEEFATLANNHPELRLSKGSATSLRKS